VTERTATPALEVNPGLATPLFVITDPHRLWLMIDVPEKLLARVKAGSVVSVESDAYPEDHFEAHIVQVGQVMDPNTRRVLARARLDNPSGKLLPEMLVRATVLQEGGTGVRAPNSAIINRGVYSFERRRVQLLTRGADSSYVGEGLAGGERVVTTGALLLEAERATSADKP
jgi:cobalt-zinc-cadmium efflux system membrane fusion protein